MCLSLIFPLVIDRFQHLEIEALRAEVRQLQHELLKGEKLHIERLAAHEQALQEQKAGFALVCISSEV